MWAAKRRVKRKRRAGAEVERDKDRGAFISLRAVAEKLAASGLGYSDKAPSVPGDDRLPRRN